MGLLRGSGPAATLEARSARPSRRAALVTRPVPAFLSVTSVVRIGMAAAALLLIGRMGVEAQQPPDMIPVTAPRPADAQEPQPADPPFSPRAAFFRSVLLPGWGQAYVGAPGRGAVYFAVASGSFVMTYHARRQLNDARDELDWLHETGVVQPEVTSEFVLSRERHFEDWAALSLFLMFLAGADAYVSAYLADFDQRVGVVPARDGALQLRISLPAALPR